MSKTVVLGDTIVLRSSLLHFFSWGILSVLWGHFRNTKRTLGMNSGKTIFVLCGLLDITSGHFIVNFEFYGFSRRIFWYNFDCTLLPFWGYS